jgi:hypothetical protein
MGRNPFDQYWTPPELTRAFLRKFPLRPRMTIAEPFAGAGWISSELERRGHHVITGDIDPTRDVDHPGVDFLSRKADRVYDGVDAIVTNPPWSDAAACIRRALEFTPHVIALLRLSFLEPCVQGRARRADLVRRHSHHVVTPRVSFDQTKPTNDTDSVTSCWFVWGFRHDGRTQTTADVITESDLEAAKGQLRLC